MPSKSAVIIMDYAKNCSCTSQDEVQSAHWSNTQVTIHHVMAFINATYVMGPFTHKEAVIFISNDMKHNADGVAHFMSLAYPYLNEKHGLLHVEVFSDCCAAQHRSGKSLADLSNHPGNYDTSITHNYFESSHGKSSAGGLGAIVKHAAKQGVTRRQYTIRNAEELYRFCTDKLAEVGKGVYPSVQKKRANSARILLCGQGDCATTLGEQRCQNHHWPGQVKLRALSCHCENCMGGQGTSSNTEYAGPWRSA